MGVVNRRILTVVVALVPIVAFGRAAVGGDCAVRGTGAGSDVRHARRGRRQAGRRHRGHRRPGHDRTPQHDDRVPERRHHARSGARAVDVGYRSSWCRATSSTRRTSRRTRSTRPTTPTSSDRRTAPNTPRCRYLKYPDGGHRRDRHRPRAVGGHAAGRRRHRHGQQQARRQPRRVHRAVEGHQTRRPARHRLSPQERRDRHDDDHPRQERGPRLRLPRRRRARRAVGRRSPSTSTSPTSAGRPRA